jgi:hypothetical protein
VKPIRMNYTNAVLKVPAGWDESKLGPCVGLPGHRDESLLLVYSWWSLTWRERLGLLIGRTLRLGVVGRSMPPVSLDVDADAYASNEGKDAK